MEKSDIGLIGLAVMGANLARNISRNSRITVFNRTTEKTTQFIKEFGSETLDGSKTLKEFTKKLAKPRKIILMVKSGEPVDIFINKLLPLLDKNDTVIDGGNSNYKDTARRQEELSKKGIHFIGMGISGGEEGALNGPSMMPGGNKVAYSKLEKILAPAAAKDGLGGTCISYVGKGGSGHFVKMVHNGIEYAVMQLIAETYDILKHIGKFSNKELSKAFEDFNKPLNSFLLEITARIFKEKDPFSKKDLIDVIKDSAGQKGTGKWTSIAAFDYGVPTPTINAAVDARITSGNQDLRHRRFGSPEKLNTIKVPNKSQIKALAQSSLEIGTLIAYAQGFELLMKASQEHNWNLDLSETSRIWRGGCIIRSNYLDLFQRIYSDKKPAAIKAVKEILEMVDGKPQKNWRKTVELGTAKGIPMPALSASLAYYDSIRKLRLPQNLIQAQRDLFGAHTYERIDKKGTFHTDW
ncbi:NADP-dependent phosphogluconate dehydrogenase [Candidatus Peregrinibacteria bacterium]|nr:NADP-dependent phosphogluconate dehydrogenase [Candidatus Peregrinibacteria bacterium]